jgi:hypothetical protein
MNLRDIAQKVKGYIQSKTQDDEGWIRQGNFAPKQQFQQMGQNLNAWGNIAKQGINNEIQSSKQLFNDTVWQPIKANPVLQPIAQRYENALPAIKNQLNPFKPLDRKQNWEDSKALLGAGLTTAGLLASPAVKLSSMLGGALISPVITAGMNLLEKKPIGEGVVESIPVGAGQGLANAGTTRLTNYLVQGLANKIPVLKSLTEEAIKKGVPAAGDTLKQGFQKLLNTGGKRLIKAAVLETAVESPIWATLTQTEKETYLQALQRETTQNLAMNIGMAGVNTAMDSRAMGSIIKKSVDTAIENYMKSASTPQALEAQSGKIDLGSKVGIADQPIKTGGDVSPLSPESKGIKVKPNDDLVTKFDETIKVGEQPKIKVSPLETPKQPELRQRGFSASVQESPNVSKQVKQEVLGGYEPKQNEVLMGEAKGLLEEGVDVDLRNIKDIDKKVAATMQEAINQQKTNPQLAANLFNNLSEKGTELGRGVQAFALLRRMSPESIALSASGLIKKYNRLNPTKQIPELNGDQVKIISDKVAELDLLKGREKNIALNELNEIINSFIPSKLTDKLITVWKAGLLTSLRTHERNFVGNAIHGVMEIAKDIPATATDIGLSKITGQRSKTFTVKGLGEFGSKKTGQQMIDIVKRGFDPTEQINKFDYKKVNWGNNLIEKGLKKYTDTVFRTLGASDKPFYNAALARSLYDQAAVAAINAGKKGNKQFIEALVSKPTEEMLKIAIGDANVSTFKDKNAATNVVNQLKQALGKNQFSKVIGEITMPFTGVPTSILGQIQAYSPIGLIKGIYKVGKVASGKVPELQRQASEELGRGVIGTGIFGLGAYLAGQGLITGQPKDATEARQWELENKPRNSIMIGGKWRSLNSIGPEAVVFLAGAKLNEELNSEGGNLGTYGLKIGKDYLDQSFVTGLQQPVNALTDPARYGKSYLGNQSSSFIPNIVKDFSKSIDPNAREANTVMDYAKLGTPARLGMIEKRDALGNVIPQEPTGVGAFIDLFNSKTPRSSETIKELSRLYKVGESATPSKLTASQTIIPGQEKVKLTFEQLNNLEKGVGEILQPQLEKLVTSPVYQKLTDEKKANAISNLVSDVRSKYKLQNANSLTGGKVNISGGYVDKSGSFKEVNTDTIPKPEYTGNATIDKKLKTQYENAIEKQKVDIALSKQNQEVSGLQKEYSYIDENGNYKSVDLSPVQFPELTGDTIVDKKLKSSYYSEINAQINNVIKLNKAGEITQDEMIKMVTALNKQYTAGKGGKKPKKITAKIIKITSPKANIKFSSPRASKFKLKPSPKIKITKTDNRKYTIKA